MRQLGEDVAATGFLGGSLGGFIRTQITQLGIQDHFVESTGDSRNCIAVIHEGNQTEILESGPEITYKEATTFLEKFTSSIQEVDFVTISGSIPKGLGEDFYVKSLEIAWLNNTPVLLDTSGESLKFAINNEHKPFLLKPNLEELTDLLGREINDEVEIINSLNELIFKDVPWIVVTLGSKGALVKHIDSIYRVLIPKVEAINPVGSGDSVIAGFAAGFSRKLPEVELIKFGVAMGVLNAMEEKTGYINSEKVNWCMKRIQIEKYK